MTSTNESPAQMACPYSGVDVGWNPTDPDHANNPETFFAAWRKAPELPHHPIFDSRMVATHKGCVEVLTNPAFSAAPSVPHINDEVMNPDPEVQAILAESEPGGTHVLQTDGATHSRLRAQMSSIFMPHVKPHRPQIRGIADRLIDGFANQEEAELMSQFCLPHVWRSLVTLIGFPEDDADTIRSWADDYFALMTPPEAIPVEVKRAAARGYVNYNSYIGQHLQARLNNPDAYNDVLSRVAALINEGTSWADAYMMVRGFFAGGGHTTINGEGNTIYDVLAHGRWSELASTPQTVRSFIDEALRRESPLRGLQRVATQDTEVAGTPIPAGTSVLPLLGSANRDENKFTQADLHQVDRENRRDHIAFGKGEHECIGRSAAYAIMTEGLQRLAERLPNMKLAPGFTPQYGTTIWFFRELQRLDVAVQGDRESAP